MQSFTLGAKARLQFVALRRQWQRKLKAAVQRAWVVESRADVRSLEVRDAAGYDGIVERIADRTSVRARWGHRPIH